MFLTGILFSDKSKQLTLNINEILSIRSTKIKLSSGLVDVAVPEDEPNKDIPNVLYVYYGYKQNIYIWRVRKAALYFSTTNEKKQWEALLKEAMSGELLWENFIIDLVRSYRPAQTFAYFYQSLWR